MLICYCRGCNRDVEVCQIIAGYYVENFNGNEHFHPKEDCDVLERKKS